MDSNVDLVVKAMKAANRKPMTTIDIVRATGLTKHQVRTAAGRAANSSTRKVVRLAKGVFCYDPPEGTKAYESGHEAVKKLIKVHGELDKEFLAKELGIKRENVQEVISKARVKYGLKIKRHVVYRLEQ